MKIVATICSRVKREGADLMPASERYAGAHIAHVSSIAKDIDVPFYILSGKFGLIAAETPVPDYDYLLTEAAVDALVPTIVSQLTEDGITEIVFYSKNGPHWKPYETALTHAAKEAEVDFVLSILEE